MQGQIIDAAVASNQGMILGDDGARYTFNSGGWRDASVKAVAGMRVEFSPQGPMAMEVVVIRAASPARSCATPTGARARLPGCPAADTPTPADSGEAAVLSAPGQPDTPATASRRQLCSNLAQGQRQQDRHGNSADIFGALRQFHIHASWMDEAIRLR